MTIGKKQAIFIWINMDLTELEYFIAESNDIDLLVDFFNEIKQRNKKEFDLYMEKIKVLYASSNDYNFISSASLLFSEFKIHSSVHLIISKLLSGKFNDCGGTLLYSLLPLKKVNYREMLRLLWSKDISWEMKQKLEIMNIYPAQNP